MNEHRAMFETRAGVVSRNSVTGQGAPVTRPVLRVAIEADLDAIAGVMRVSALGLFPGSTTSVAPNERDEWELPGMLRDEDHGSASATLRKTT